MRVALHSSYNTNHNYIAMIAVCMPVIDYMLASNK